MWWKIYFFILTLLGIGALFTYLDAAPITFIDFLGIIGLVLAVLAVYSYSFKKKILKKETWKIIFWAQIILAAIDLINVYLLPKDFLENTLPFLVSKLESTPTDVLVGSIFAFPAFYAMYQLSRK